MKIAVNAKELIVDGACAFVPTMGALHAGHASLIKKAREYSDTVVVSIFINPLQFENKDDLAKYPRTPEFDIELASQAGATHLWLPTVDEIYPGEVQKISAGALGDIYEGVKRPGHFDGVLTVVNRLFELVKPHWAIF
jgi:pantoate--beta-alanine ligase